MKFEANKEYMQNLSLHYLNHRSESVFDKSSDEEVLEILCDEYSVRTKQKKNSGEKDGGKLATTTNNYSQCSSNMSLNS